MAILNFRHKGLELFFTRGNSAGIQAKHAARLRLILGRLHAAAELRDMTLPGLHLHRLTGDRRGTWSFIVSGNWRITSELSGPDVKDVNYEDYR